MNKLVLSFMSTTFIASAVFAQASTTTTTSAAPTAGASTTTAASPAAANKIKGSFTHVSSKAVKEDKTAAKLETINAIGVSYKPEDISYGASFKAYYNLVGEEQAKSKDDSTFMKQADAKATYSDLKLAATKGVGTLGASDDITLKGTLYLPTSEKSQKADQYSAVGVELYVPFTLAHGFSTQLVLIPIYSIKKGDDKFFNETFGEIRYAFSDKASTYVGVYHDFTGSAGETTKRSAETLAPELGVDVSFPKIVDLTFAATQSRNILNPTGDVKRKSYALLAPEETSLSVQAVFQF